MYLAAGSVFLEPFRKNMPLGEARRFARIILLPIFRRNNPAEIQRHLVRRAFFPGKRNGYAGGYFEKEDAQAEAVLLLDEVFSGSPMEKIGQSFVF